MTNAYKKVSGLITYMFYSSAKPPRHHQIIEGINQKISSRKPQKLSYAPPAEIRKLQKNEKLTSEEKKRMRIQFAM